MLWFHYCCWCSTAEVLAVFAISNKSAILKARRLHDVGAGHITVHVAGVRFRIRSTPVIEREGLSARPEQAVKNSLTTSRKMLRPMACVPKAAFVRAGHLDRNIVEACVQEAMADGRRGGAGLGLASTGCDAKIVD